MNAFITSLMKKMTPDEKIGQLNQYASNWSTGPVSPEGNKIQEIKDGKVVPHVSAVCRSGERQHPELESETIYYLGNRLVVAIGNFGHAWLQENLPISGK